jgi:hypothetical protein
VEKIKAIRRDKEYMIFLKKNNFERFFKKFLRSCQYIFYQSNVLITIIHNFLIIKQDLIANNNEKIIRTLSVILDYYQKLEKFEEYKNILYVFNDQFKKYMKTHNHSNLEMGFEAEDFCKNEMAREFFLKFNLFYVKYQRIIFILSNTFSEFINLEDTFKRKYIEIIMNDLRDIASYYADDWKKISIMENYLYIIYYKLIFYQSHANSSLALALKHIIESPEHLNLSYKYGIILPCYIDQLPNYIINNKSKSILETFILEKKIRSKERVFVKRFLKLAECHRAKNTVSCHFVTMILSHFSPEVCLENITSLDKIKMQAIVLSFLSYPNHEDRKLASQLYKLIVQSNLDENKNAHKTMFHTALLLSQLSCVTPVQQEKRIYDDLISKLHYFIANYIPNNEHQLYMILKHTYQATINTTVQPTCFVFFKQSSQFLELIKSFTRHTLNLDLNNIDSLSPTFSS